MGIEDLTLEELISKLSEAQESETNIKHLIRMYQAEVMRRHKSGELNRKVKKETKKPGGGVF